MLLLTSFISAETKPAVWSRSQEIYFVSDFSRQPEKVVGRVVILYGCTSSVGLSVELLGLYIGRSLAEWTARIRDHRNKWPSCPKFRGNQVGSSYIVSLGEQYVRIGECGFRQMLVDQ